MLGGMSSVPFLYRLLTRALRLSAPLFAFSRSKLTRGIEGRRSAVEALEAWARQGRDPARPTVWFHAPSVGEGLQAGAVMRALRARRPEVQIVFTHFSPSAEGLGERLGAHTTAYLPWDVQDSVRRALDALRPSLLVFTKTEVWPVLVEAARARGIPVALVGGTVHERSGRLRWLARVGLRGTWASLDLACACTREDQERLVTLGVKPSTLHVTGDPGVDAAALSVLEADTGASYLAPFRVAPRPTVVAGSTWPADEAVLADAWQGVRQAHPRALLVIAPHEPTGAHVASVLERFRRVGSKCVTLAEVERRESLGEAEVVIVDRVGVLAHLYIVATVAYVGGGFGRAGLHSVLEPAVAGVPTLFGPRHENSRAADALKESGAGRVVVDAKGVEDGIERWISDPDEKNQAAGSAEDYIGAHRGAGERSAALLEAYIDTKEQA